MTESKWIFPDNGSGEIKGFNDAIIETFNDNPLKSLAREICQNSLDAALTNGVIVEFKTFELEKNNFPAQKELEEVFTKCLDFAQDLSNPKTRNFFTNAIDVISGKRICFLRISDFNTTGLRGSNKKVNTDWAKLVYSTGTSDKNGGKGGSFGLGKGAPFACSALRTVFYSTQDVDGLEASQGVSRLTSFVLNKNADGSDRIAHGVGYWGIADEYHIYPNENMIRLDNTFKRTTPGTDIYIAGLKKDIYANIKEFESTIINEVLDGFITAIYDGKLEVRVNSFVVNKETLSTIMSNPTLTFSSTTRMCYELLASNKTTWENLPIRFSNMTIGNIQLAFSLRIDGNNKVSMIRSSGMKILDRDKLCPTLRYVGIAKIEGEKLNEWLINMENPSHNKWEPTRHDNPSTSKQLLSEIYGSIKEKLDEYAEKNIDSTSDITGAGAYIPEMQERNGKGIVEKKLKSDNSIIKIKKDIGKKVNAMAGIQTKQLGEDILGNNVSEGSMTQGIVSNEDKGTEMPIYHGGERNVSSTKEKVPTNGTINKPRVTVKSKQIRIFCINKQEQLYRLLFTPTESTKKGLVLINKIDENAGRAAVTIVSAYSDQKIFFSENKIENIIFSEDEQIKIDLKIQGHEYNSMEVQLYAYKG